MRRNEGLKRGRTDSAVLCVLAVVLSFQGVGRAQTNFAVIKSFGHPEESAIRPLRGVVEGSDGSLYGTTYYGGASPGSESYTDAGTVFRMEKNGSGFVILHHFNRSDGRNPVGLFEASDGQLYGITLLGGSRDRGSVFRLRRDGGGFETIHGFGGTLSEGHTSAYLTESSNGWLYGMTLYGGGTNSGGTIFRLQKDGSDFSVVYSFNFYPISHGPLVAASDGQLFGSSTGGEFGEGSIYRVGSASGLTVIYASPSNSILSPHLAFEGSDGLLYGTGYIRSGTNTAGAVFSIGKDGSQLVVLKTFSSYPDPGAELVGLAEGLDGYLYGCTRGAVFRIDKAGQNFSILHEFADDGKGSNPASGVVASGDGNLYGTTTAGAGPSYGSGNGVVYTLRPDGSNYQVLHRFDKTGGDESAPKRIIPVGDTLYGITTTGGSASINGSVFVMKHDGTEYRRIVALTNITTPTAIVWGGDGYLYGTATYGGGADSRGAVFKAGTNEADLQILHAFRSAGDGAYPETLMLGSDQRLYGTAYFGQGGGTVFRLERDGTQFTVLRTINEVILWIRLFEGMDGNLYGASYQGVFKLSKDGQQFEVMQRGVRISALLHGGDEKLYGTTFEGGAFGRGTVFRMTTAGTDYRLLHSFANSSYRHRLIEGSDGVLYGSTYSGGVSNSATVFRIRKDGSGYRIVREVFPANRGPRGVVDLVEGSDGALYVATEYGGLMNLGTICRLLAPPEIIELARTSGNTRRIVATATVGRSVTVQGSANLLDWVTVGSAASVDGAVAVQDPGPEWQHRFYRAFSD